MPTVLITGGTGTIGKRLCELMLRKGYRVIVLTRHIARAGATKAEITYARWNPGRGEIDPDAIRQSDYIINLAGAGVADERWTARRKKEILESRTGAGHLLVKALETIPNTVKAVVSASGAGYYGPDNLLSLNDGFTEDDPAAGDFLGRVCEAWEQSISPVTALGKRLVILRTGIVLSRHGGALEEFCRPLRFGIGAVLSHGRQVVSWIHEDDICNMYIYALEQEHLSGPYNAVAPAPVSNKELVTAIARARGGLYIRLKVPGFALRLLLGEMSEEVLKSAHLSAGRIVHSGFSFAYPDIKSAAGSLLHR